MALIPPFFLDCIVAIGFTQNGEVRYGATGFLFGYLIKDAPTPQDKQYHIYLVTSRHVFQGHAKAFLRFNPSTDEPARVYDLDLRDAQGNVLWHASSDPNIDIAVQSINVKLLKEHSIQLAFFLSDQHVLLRPDATTVGLTEGDGVFILGFPMGEVGKERNYITVRQGVIARVRDTLVGAANDFLVDAFIFPGNSGGPVVTRPEAIAITDTRAIDRAWLIGVVSSYVPYQDVAISQQTNRPRIIFEENSGLAVVVPIDRVVETVIELEQLRQQAAPPAFPPQPAA